MPIFTLCFTFFQVVTNAHSGNLSHLPHHLLIDAKPIQIDTKSLILPISEMGQQPHQDKKWCNLIYFLVEKGQKMPNFSQFLECSNPIKTRMKQFDTFLVENVYLKNTKSELFPPKTFVWNFIFWSITEFRKSSTFWDLNIKFSLMRKQFSESR